MSVALRLGIVLLLACSALAAYGGRRIQCENRWTRLSCGRRGGLINVTEANYGRTNNLTCSRGIPQSHLNNTDCLNPNATEVVAKRCNGKRGCWVKASNYFFFNPCPGTYKYLDVSYTCTPPPPPPRRLIKCQNRWAVPWCVAGVIRVESAVYGRTSRRVCRTRRWWQVRNTRCTRNVTSIVAARCNGNQWCFIGVRNSVFGDPCRGTYKYLDMKYSCLT